ncbi:unnamed protein product [Orchesella dallaii]|uniref:Fanconi-associated nuclease n=1 Tax=Orchesella dallaii TaxID=48710 RepID=A0ABP1R7Y5_9HEXA
MKRAARLKFETNPNQRKITQFFSRTLASPRFHQPDAAPPPQSLPSRRRGVDNVRTRTAVVATPRISTTNSSSSNFVSDDDDILEVVEVPKPPPSPKELIVISDSDIEAEDGTVVVAATAVDQVLTRVDYVGVDVGGEQVLSSTSSPVHVQNNSDSLEESDGEISSRVHFAVEQQLLNPCQDEQLPSQNSEELFPEPVESGSPNGDASNSNRVGAVSEDKSFDSDSFSGDEILSQIDIDEVVRLSQSSVSEGEHEQSQAASPSIVGNLGSLMSQVKSASSKENSPPASAREETRSIGEAVVHPRSPPKKSPKSPLNKFSPIRHLRKRTSSEASLGSPSKLGVVAGGETRIGRGRPSPKKALFGDSAVTSAPTHSESLRVRYYLKNFVNILDEVVGDAFHAHLISPSDREMVECFRGLSIDAQSLYVRLFQRKWDWKPVAKIKYKELPMDLSQLCRELTKSDFLEEMCEKTKGLSLEQVLDTLDLPKMLLLSKKMMISGVGGRKSKEACKEALLNKVKNQKTLTGQGTSCAILKAALKELGSAYRVTATSKSLFSRLFILYSPPKYWEVETDQASNQLLVILLNNMGQMEYPTYNINKTTLIYPNRDQLIRFHSAWSLHTSLVAYTESKEWEQVVHVSDEASSLLQSLLEDQETMEHDNGLPPFLRIYTAGSVLSHACWMGVDGLQKLKRFQRANELIQQLLSQTTYLNNYRGRYYERLAINATHLKYSKEAQKLLLEQGLKDLYLRNNHKLILSTRLEKLRASILLQTTKISQMRKKAAPQRKKQGRARTRATKKLQRDDSTDTESDDDDDFVTTTDSKEIVVVTKTKKVVVEDEVEEEVELFRLNHEIPTRTITGEKMDRGPGNMGKAVFISHQDSMGSNQISSVEQHAIQYYVKEEGYTTGLHGEGSTVSTLYGILFWDIIFNDQLPDSFHTPYQPFPLDFHFDDFYLRRRDLIEEKLQLIRNVLSMDELCGIVDQIWSEQRNKLSIVSWSLFGEDPSLLKNLMRAMGKEAIAHICERLAKNYRYAASGFPDLTVWNDREVMFVEVKGPGDSLSPKQQLWLDFLLDKHIPCEVCHVKGKLISIPLLLTYNFI